MSKVENTAARAARLRRRLRELEAECARIRAELGVFGGISESIGDAFADGSAKAPRSSASTDLYREIAQILDISADAIVSIDDRGLIRRFNRGAEIVFGYQSSEVIGRPLDILIPERFRKLHRDHLAAFGREPGSSRLKDRRKDLRGLRKDGAEFPAEISIARLESDGRYIFTAILRDISGRSAESDT